MAAQDPELPDEIKTRISQWESDNRLVVLKQPEVAKALGTLVKNGLDGDNLLLVLDLLRAYTRPELFKASMGRLERWISRGKNLSKRMLLVADDFEKLDPILDPQFVEELRTNAENLESLMKTREMMAQEGVFGRKFAGTTEGDTAAITICLVMASELIARATGKKSYVQLWTVLSILSTHIRQASAIGRRITRFKERNPEIVDGLRADIACGRHLRWLDEFLVIEQRRRQPRQAASPATPS